jgi:hypothetical protein
MQDFQPDSRLGQMFRDAPRRCKTEAVSIARDEMRSRVLSVATDNDGLWEFAAIVRDGATGQEAYDHLRPVMVELVRDGLLTIQGDDRVQLSDEEAYAVLQERSNWVQPSEPGGDWHRGADAFAVSLTSQGQAALDDA